MKLFESEDSLHARCPVGSCTCGIYAYDSLDRLIQGSKHEFSPYSGASFRVFGQISMWGLTHVHKEGIRSEFAYPYGIYDLRKNRLFIDKTDDKAIAETYNVDLLPAPKPLIELITESHKKLLSRVERDLMRIPGGLNTKQVKMRRERLEETADMLKKCGVNNG